MSVGLEKPPDRHDGALQLGRDARGRLVSAGQVVEAVAAELEIPAPPLVESELGTAQGLADVLDRATGKAESDSTFACGEFVVHGYLRGAAASGCPRRSL